MPARFAQGLSADFRTTPGLIFFYSYSGRIAVTWRIGGLVTWLLAKLKSPPVRATLSDFDVSGSIFKPGKGEVACPRRPDLTFCH
jgi:hypothetical protein